MLASKLTLTTAVLCHSSIVITMFSLVDYVSDYALVCALVYVSDYALVFLLVDLRDFPSIFCLEPVLEREYSLISLSPSVVVFTRR